MKKILILIFFLASLQSFGQGIRTKPVYITAFIDGEFKTLQVISTPPIGGYTKINARYEWTAGAMDSGFHVPQYNGVPSGVRGGVWSASGAVAVDTSNHRLYFYSGGSWRYSTASTGGGTPTWQQTLTAGSALSQNNYIGGGDYTWAHYATSFRIDIRRGLTSPTQLSIDTIVTSLSNGVSNENAINLWNDSTVLKGNTIILRGGNVGIGTNTPDSLLTVEQGIRGKRGVRFDGLPTFADTTNYKPVVINSSGTLYKATYWPGGGGGSGITVGTTTITSGTNTRILYNNSGVVGEYTTTGSGTVVALQTSPSLLGNVGIAQGTITSDLKALDISTTWNAAGVAFTGFKLDVTNTASAAGSKLVAVTQGAQAGFWVDKNGQGEFLSNSTLGYGAYGLKLRDYSSGSVVVLQPIATGSLYITDGSGTASSLALGTRTNPADGTTFIASTGRWIINSGAFVVNRSTWLGIAQNEVLSTSIPQYGGFYDALNYFTIGAGSTGLVTFDAVGSGSAFRFNDKVGISTDATTNLQVAGTFAAEQGADVASANNLAVVSNSVEITGTTQINLIANTGWVNGSRITLYLPSGITIKHNQTSSGSNIKILLDGAADLTTSSASTISFILGENGGTQAWRQDGKVVADIQQMQQSRVASQFDKTSNTTLADVTGLTANVAAGKTYRFEAHLYTTSGISGGIKFAIGGTATATTFVADMLGLSDVGTTNFTGRTTTAGAALGITAAQNASTYLTGLITVNAAGTLTIQFAQNASNGTTSSVLVGSTFIVTEIQ